MFFAEGTLTSEQAQTYRTAGVIALLGNSAPGPLSQNATNMLTNQGQTEAALRKCDFFRPDLVSTLGFACVAAASAALKKCQTILALKAAAGIIRCLAFLSIPFFGIAKASFCVLTIILFKKAAFKACGLAFAAALTTCLLAMGADYVDCIAEDFVGY